MMIKPWISSKNRARTLTWLGYAAQIALVLGISLERLENPALDFIQGFLIGFSIVGNLAYIYISTQYFNENGGKNDWKRKN